MSEIRVRSTCIYLTADTAARSSAMDCFLCTSEKNLTIDSTHVLSLPAPLSLQPSHNETNSPALSEMHYFSAYLSAHYSESCLTFIHQCYAVTCSHFANETQSGLFVCRICFQGFFFCFFFPVWAFLFFCNGQKIAVSASSRMTLTRRLEMLFKKKKKQGGRGRHGNKFMILS